MGGRTLSEKEQARAGTPLTEQKWRFQVVEIRGDWEFHKLIWELPRCGWKAVNICFKCAAQSRNTEGLEYWDCSENSQWAKNPFSTAEFMSLRLPEQFICAAAARIFA